MTAHKDNHTSLLLSIIFNCDTILKEGSRIKQCAVSISLLKRKGVVADGYISSNIINDRVWGVHFSSYLLFRQEIKKTAL